jgi:hypothetical protein
MAKSRKKKKSNAALTYNVRNYFDSGRVVKLPLEPTYLAEIPAEDGQLIRLITITREHINGNKAYATFVIDASCSCIDTGYYDYNVADEIIDVVIKEYGLQVYDDYLALRDTIYAVYTNAKQLGNAKDPQLPFALKILEGDSGDAPKKRSLIKDWTSGKSAFDKRGESLNREKGKTS